MVDAELRRALESSHLCALPKDRIVELLAGSTTIDLAEPDDSGTLVVPVSQRALAESAGTAREVVVRFLRQLRDDGVVRSGRGRIVLVDPDRLLTERGWHPRS